MPATFTITREDLLRSKTVTPTWYRCKITKVEQKAAGTDGSTNTIISLVVDDGGPFQGVPVDRTFNEKAPGFAISFAEALQGGKKLTDGATLDFEKGVGHNIMVFIANKEYQGRLLNDAKDFKPCN